MHAVHILGRLFFVSLDNECSYAFVQLGIHHFSARGGIVRRHRLKTLAVLERLKGTKLKVAGLLIFS